MIDNEETTPAVSDLKPHETSLAVWDLPSPLVVNCPSKIKVGAKCMAGCQLTGQGIEIRDAAGHRVAVGKLGPAPWSGTDGLYWAELDLIAPETEGTHSWIASCTPNLELPHLAASSGLSLITVRSPEHDVAIEIVQQHTNAPVRGAEVRLGAYRVSTDEGGLARLEVLKGQYALNVWKLGYELRSGTLDVASDLTVRLELTPVVEHEDPYWM